MSDQSARPGLPAQRLRLIIAIASISLIGTGLGLTAIMHSAVEREIDDWGWRSLMLAANARVHLVKEYSESALKAATALSLRGVPRAELGKYNMGLLPLNELQSTLHPMLTALVKQLDEVHGAAVVDASGEIIVKIGLMPDLSWKSEHHRREVRPMLVDGKPMLIAKELIEEGGKVLGLDIVAYGLEGLANRFDDDLGLGPGAEKRLLATINGRLEELLPLDRLPATDDSIAFKRLMEDPSLVDSNFDMVLHQDPMDGILMPIPGTGMVVVIDLDHGSHAFQRRQRTILATRVISLSVATASVAVVLLLVLIARSLRQQSLRLAASQEQLRQRADELRRSNADLEQFATVISHDLQEPLRMVSSFTGLTRRRFAAELPPQGREYLDQAADGAVRMQHMIRSLLEYSRIGRGIDLAEEVDSSGAVREALSNLRAAIEEANVDVDVGSLPRVRCNRSLLVQLFQNLIGNAVKFSDKSTPRVSVRATLEGAHARFAISDNGIGIDPQHFERLFKPFARLHTREEFPGTGIGLATCKRIVDGFSGSIWVESKPGEGSTFFFTVATAGQES